MYTFNANMLWYQIIKTTHNDENVVIVLASVRIGGFKR